MFCAQFSLDLDLRPFDLGSVRKIKSLICQTYLLILSFLSFSVPELCVTQSDHITITWSGHCACAVSRDLSPGAKIIHIIEIPDPNWLIHFVTFRELRRRLISYVICEKKRLSHCEGYKVHCACAVSRDLCIGVPQNHIFWSRLIYSLYNFYGDTVTIKGSLYWSISMF